jgi:hypothetical protein
MPLSNWEEESKFPLRTSCKEAAQLVNLSLERKLTAREFITMRYHLFWCKTCGYYKKQITALRRIFIRNEELLESTPPSEDEKLSTCCRDRINRSIQENI